MRERPPYHVGPIAERPDGRGRRGIEKCFCGRELRSKEERDMGECRRCLEEYDDES